MFLTTRNSLYELDAPAKRIRRVRGANPPTKHFTPNGEWKPFESIHYVEEGWTPAVLWGDNTATTLSVVESITEGEPCELSTTIA